MTDDPHGARNIPIGTPVVGFDGTLLGRVHEVHPHYLLVGQEGLEGQEGEHSDLEVPVHAIRGFEGGKLQVSVTRGAVTEIEDVVRPHNPREQAR